MVKGWEKLGNVKSKGACIDVLMFLTHSEQMKCVSDSSINRQTLFKSTQLTWVN